MSHEGREVTGILARLAGGDRRSVGRSGEVAAAVLSEPERVTELIAGLDHHDPVVRARAADALEKVSRQRPDLIGQFKASLLGPTARASQADVRWHVAQMLPRLPLTRSEREVALDILRGYLEDRSSIVRTCALQAIAEIAAACSTHRGLVDRLLKQAIESGTPAMKARARKLVASARQAKRGGDE